MSRNDDAQNADIAFTLVARNEKAQEMWTDPYNSSRYVLLSQGPAASRQTSEFEDYEEIDPEHALQFRFSEKPNDYAKGFVLGSDKEKCDVLLRSDEDYDPEMVAFTYNQQYELIMNVTSIQYTTVKYNDQRSASRQRFSWILPRDQKMIRVTIAQDAGLGNDLIFDVVLPTYDPSSIDEYHKNCEPFIIPGVGEELIAEVFNVGDTAVTVRGGVTVLPAPPFYLRKEKLGQGTFGTVHKVQRLPDGKFFAAKFMRLPDPNKTRNFDAKKLKSEVAFRKEVKTMKKLCKTPHDNIVQFVDEWDGDFALSMILEYIPGGTLQQQLRQIPSVQMEPGEIMNMSYQMMKALEFVHDKGLIHRDVKPENILRKSREHYLLADFGCSGKLGPVLSKRGTPKYMAPEVGTNKSYGFEADIWSLGVVILACLEKLPQGDVHARPEWCANLRRMVIDYQSLFKRYSDNKPEIQKQAIQLILLLQRYMLQLNPENRLPAKKLLENFPSLWEAVSPQTPSRIEDAEAQDLSGASKIEEGEEFEIMTPPSVGTSFVPELEYDEDAPAPHQRSHTPPGDPSKPSGEANITGRPGVGEKRKRGDLSVSDDSSDDATTPGQRATAVLEFPVNYLPGIGHMNVLPLQEVQHLRMKHWVEGQDPPKGD